MGLCLLFAVLTAWGQKNFQPGWIVNNNGDTIKGVISYSQWVVNPSTIRFESSGKTVTYSVSDLRAFGVNSTDFYRRFSLTRHSLPMNDIDNLPDDEQSITTSTEWARILVPGKYGLAEFRTEERPYFFIVEDDKATELVYYKGMKSYTADIYKGTANYGKSGFREVSTYQDQLKQLTIRSNAQTPSADYTRYNSFELTKYFYKLNGSTAAAQHNSRSSFEVHGGATVYSMSFVGDKSVSSFPGNVSASTSPFIGIRYELFPARALARGGIFFGLDVSSISATGNSVPYATQTMSSV